MMTLKSSITNDLLKRCFTSELKRQMDQQVVGAKV